MVYFRRYVQLMNYVTIGFDFSKLAQQKESSSKKAWLQPNLKDGLLLNSGSLQIKRIPIPQFKIAWPDLWGRWVTRNQPAAIQVYIYLKV
jgi:hypothetical protein